MEGVFQIQSKENAESWATKCLISEQIHPWFIELQLLGDAWHAGLYLKAHVQ